MDFSKTFDRYPGMDCEEMHEKVKNKKLLKRVARRIRQITPRDEKQPCYVCGKYKQIAHLHHPFPVEDLTLFVLFYDLYSSPLYIPVVWLCPNHHALYHLVEGSCGCLPREDYANISDEELEKMSEIANMVDARKITAMIKKESIEA